MQYSEAYIDLDDTLNNFTAEVGMMFHVAKHPEDLSWCEPALGFDMFGQLRNAIEKQGRYTPVPKDLFRLLPERYWQLELASGAKKLVDTALAYFGESNVFFLSHACTPDSAKYKYEWCEQHYPKLINNLVLTKAKPKLAGPGRLLIDDALHNTDAWAERGGASWVVSKPWNYPNFKSGDDVQCRRRIVEFLEGGVRLAAA